ncbi:hypothetical protein [Shewanella pneumatophori]|uniref:Translesion DNA synthesis-associated protein ImuA n=1 Tax=Shewanella pneumatophori TaxID=314092 RepID=A0A9X1Z8I2_9GAMM|nr:hypothetical protein [Shewanella pneumatophori]MCL1137499.1 hypothetical protein [Shewanella pneumatophori]
MSYAKALTVDELKEASIASRLQTNQRSSSGLKVKPPLVNLLERQDLWLGEQWQHQNEAYCTGFSLLNKHLADNGWPKQGVCECLYDNPGQGELTLVLPLLQQLIGQGVVSQTLASEQHSKVSKTSATDTNHAEPLVMLVAPPYIPNPQALELQGIEVERLIWIDSSDRKEQLWAIEQALSSGAVPLVLAWLDYLSITESRRLQLAAEKGQALCLLYLPSKLADNSHPVNLRLTLKRSFFSRKQMSTKVTANTQLFSQEQTKKRVNANSGNTIRAVEHCGDSNINIIKRRGGWPSKAFSLSLLPPHLQESLLGTANYLTPRLAAEVLADVEPHRVTTDKDLQIEQTFKLSIVNNASHLAPN